MTLLHGDCLKIMKALPRDSIDFILADIPYGTTACKWDQIIPFEPMWKELKRIRRGAIGLFGSEPFSSTLRMSNIDEYKYDWYWDKKFGGNFVQAKRMPLKTVETISIFGLKERMPKYYPIMEKRDVAIKQGGRNTNPDGTSIPVKNNPTTHLNKIYEYKNPVTKLFFPKELGRTVHPTQKPVALLVYLIKTYTLEGETVLDFTMGSGSTGVACKNLNRKFIGIEQDEKYYQIAVGRCRRTDK